MIEKLSKLHVSPLKGVRQPSPAATSADISRAPILAQVRACSPKVQPGEHLSFTELLSRCFTRDAPAEVDRPL